MSTPATIEDRNSAEEAFSLCVMPPRIVRYHSSGSPGVQTLGIGNERESLLYIPKNYRSELPSPLMVLLHGAKGAHYEWVELFRHIADSMNIIFLAPSRQQKRSFFDGKSDGKV